MEGFKRSGSFEWSHYAGLAQALLFAAAQATQAEKEEIQHSSTWPSSPLSIVWT